MQKLLIVGLGNPDPQYLKNRHNIGFMVLDALASELGINFKESKNLKSLLAVSSHCILCKPLTYMNASGNAVHLVRDYYKPSDLLVIHDELEIAFGALRFKRGGGHGGHNGLKSIDASCGNEYVRARFGIGRPPKKEDVAHYVLSDFQEDPSELIEHCIKAISFFVQKGDLHQMQAIYTLKGKE
ncbi:aminoacyl-tRNA hydrolase [Helicobacter kayseriensis]|uniref:aminoacyl-tRNA hydrolase n=1 Tax=Helicobacter kayseriensis TaxID=2905877 RepID=UPI001E5FE689|nr:aminoacyl-tRNA hydrolase [Helicobacter kayseriensis]MCE3046866.1 aminoacyl-tRNA hydrolase [Helicobacter kayseriensis]MCE3048474.1 aminoacyl-tRNA hydrolase [Helicobacter kayseriensis]